MFVEEWLGKHEIVEKERKVGLIVVAEPAFDCTKPIGD